MKRVAGNTLKMSLIIPTRGMPQINSQCVQISKFSILLTSLYVLASKLSGSIIKFICDNGHMQTVDLYVIVNNLIIEINIHVI